jgi:hypothetical protein
MDTFMDTNCVPVTDALFRIFEYATNTEIFMMNGEQIHFHHEAYNIAPCIFVSKLWNKIATKYLEHICMHWYLRSQYSITCDDCGVSVKFRKDTLNTYTKKTAKMHGCKHGNPIVMMTRYHKYAISSFNPRSIISTVMRYRKVYNFENVTSLPTPFMDWWTAMFPQTIKLRPVHIISAHADHLIDTWMKTWPCKEKENILPLIGRFGRSDLLQTHGFQAWYPGTECAARIALEAAYNAKDDIDSDWDPDPNYKSDTDSDHDSNSLSYLWGPKTRSHFRCKWIRCNCPIMEEWDTMKAYATGLCLAVENGHELTGRMILDLFEDKFYKGVFAKRARSFDIEDKHSLEKTQAWIQKHRPKWKRQKRLNEDVDATPKKQKESHP